MIIAKQTVRRCATGLLAVLVAIMFLSAPMAEAGSARCDTHAGEIEHTASQAQDRPDDDGIDHQKACCAGLCKGCHIVLPTSVLFELGRDSNARQTFAPPPSISGLFDPPALGPPRSPV
jgi:hypothetical protein